MKIETSKRGDNSLKIKVSMVLLLCGLLLTGCWDKVEMNDRAYVISLALDDLGDLLEVTYTIPNLPVITSQSGGEATKFVKTTKSKTLVEANRNFGKKSNLRLNFDHAKVVIFGQEFLKDSQNLRKVLDHFDRNPEYSKSLLLLATKATGKSLLESVPNGEETTGIYLSQVFINNSMGTISAKTIELRDFITEMHSNEGNGVMPNIVFEDNEVIVEGLAVLKDYSLTGWMEEKHVTPYSWVLGKGRHSVVVADMEGILVPYEISELHTNMSFSLEDGLLTIRINIKSEGDVAEFVFEDQDKLFNNTYIAEIEEVLAQEMESQIDALMDTIQDEYGIDIIGASNQLKMENRKIWSKAKSDWQNFFSGASIIVNSKVNIRRIGLSK